MPKRVNTSSVDQNKPCSELELADQRKRFLSKLAEIARKNHRTTPQPLTHERVESPQATNDLPVSQEVTYPSASSKQHLTLRERPATWRVVSLYLIPRRGNYDHNQTTSARHLLRARFH